MAQEKKHFDGEIKNLQEVNRRVMVKVASLRTQIGDSKIELERDYQRQLNEERQKTKVIDDNDMDDGNQLVHVETFG